MSNSYADTLTQDISNSEPVGSDVRGLTQFDALQSEIEKLSNPHSNGSPDWPVVVELSQDLLKNYGKDLLVACYLAHGLTINQGIEGLSNGLNVIDGLTQKYWDTMYPSVKRIRGRCNAIQWFLERTESFLTENESLFESDYSFLIVSDLQEKIRAIDLFLSSHIGDDSPRFFSLKRHLENLKSLPEPQTETNIETTVEVDSELTPIQSSSADNSYDTKTKEPQGNAENKSKSASKNSEETLISNTEISEENLDAIIHNIRKSSAAISDFIFDRDNCDARSYFFKRFSVWSEITSSPPHIDFITPIPAPLEQQVDILQSLTETQNNLEIINLSEALLPIYPFWMDLSCACANALLRIGDHYKQAHCEVIGATAYFIHRFPEILNLKFNSGLAFCNEDTKQWIASFACENTNGKSGLALPPKTSAAESIISKIKNSDDIQSISIHLKGISDLFQSGKISPSELLLAKIQVCEILISNDIRADFSPLADDLMKTVEKHSLEIWDSSLAIKAWTASYKIYSKINDLEKSKKTMKRIATISTSSAFSLLTNTD